MNAYDRKAQILEVALKMGAEGLFTCITREEIAVRLGIAPGLITHHWQSMERLKDMVLEIGCERRIPHLVVVAVMHRHVAAAGLPASVKSRAINSIQ